MSNERYCCDGRCNENQGRGECPRVRSSPPAPMASSQVDEDAPSTSPGFRFVLVAVAIFAAAVGVLAVV